MRAADPLPPSPVLSRRKIEPRGWGAGCLTFELVARPALCVFHERMPPASAEIAHYHRKARQVFFVLAGALTIRIGGHDHRLQPQEALEVPPGTAHRVLNQGREDCWFLVISHPAPAGDRIPVAEE